MRSNQMTELFLFQRCMEADACSTEIIVLKNLEADSFRYAWNLFCTEIKIFSPLGVLLSKQEVQKRNITFLYEWYCLSFFYIFDNNSKMSFIHACKIE